MIYVCDILKELVKRLTPELYLDLGVVENDNDKIRLCYTALIYIIILNDNVNILKPLTGPEKEAISIIRNMRIDDYCRTYSDLIYTTYNETCHIIHNKKE